MNFDFSNLTLVQILDYLRLGLIVFDFIIIVYFFVLLNKAIKIRPRFKANPSIKPIMTVKKMEVLEKWKSVSSKLEEGTPDSLRIAVIQGDALIDSILKSAGLKGEHMADRLDNIDPAELKSFEGLWRSHKIRNQVVHNEGFVLSVETAQGVLRGYEKFLKEIKVLDS